MTRQNPLPILILLLSMVALSTASTAQSTPETESEAFEAELDRIQELTTYGPHYKNRNAAGRLLIFKRAVPTLPPAPVAARLTGPAYKNQRPIADTSRSTAVPQRKKQRRTGPRYKNRGAKTGNL